MEKLSAEYFDRLWEESLPDDGMKHTQETWDRMAPALASDPPEMEALKRKHCQDVTAYLTEKGVLDENSVVMDMGCGLGNYAAEFARRVRRVDGCDISPVMLDYAREYVKNEGVSNVEFKACDFLTCDIDAEGWRKKYDLVFTSITPAMTGLDAVNKVIAMSKGWCLNNSFVYRSDSLREAVMLDVYGQKTSPNMKNSTTYFLFNILWQLGYTPEIRYYKESSSYKVDLTEDFARHIAHTIVKDGEPEDKEVKKIYDYLLKNHAVDGKIDKSRDSVFAWTLWHAGK